jgi:hemoglobin-like flavoprotein
LIQVEGLGKTRPLEESARMNQQSIDRVLASYKMIAPRVDEMVSNFYQAVFTACPEARAMFKQDMTIQRQHLAATLALLVRNLAFQDVLEESVMELGAAHVTYGVAPHQYPIVQDALLASLAQAAGSAWTPELENDWRSVLDYVVLTMLRGAMRYTIQATAAAKPNSRSSKL